MKEVPINTEIKDYTEKVFLNSFSLKESIGLAVAAVCSIVTYQIIPESLGPIRTLACAVATVPGLFFGFVTIQRLSGLTLLKVWYRYFTSKKRLPSTSKYKYYDLFALYIEKEQNKYMNLTTKETSHAEDTTESN